MTDNAQQLELTQPPKHPFQDLGQQRCEHTYPDGSQCHQLGTWDGLHGAVLCDRHANPAAA